MEQKDRKLDKALLRCAHIIEVEVVERFQDRSEDGATLHFVTLLRIVDFLVGDPGTVHSPYRDDFPFWKISGYRDMDVLFQTNPDAIRLPNEERFIVVGTLPGPKGTIRHDDVPAQVMKRWGAYTPEILATVALEQRSTIVRRLAEVRARAAADVEKAQSMTMSDAITRLASGIRAQGHDDRNTRAKVFGQAIMGHFYPDNSALALESCEPNPHSATGDDLVLDYEGDAQSTRIIVDARTLRLTYLRSEGSKLKNALPDFSYDLTDAQKRRVLTHVRGILAPEPQPAMQPSASSSRRGDGVDMHSVSFRAGKVTQGAASSYTKDWGVDFQAQTFEVVSYHSNWPESEDVD